MSTPYYSDDLVTLYHGDCLEVAEWLYADVLVTDPPYGIDWTQGAQYNTKREAEGRAKPSVISGDKSAALRDTALDLWGDKPAIVFGSWRVPRPAKAKQRLIWYKMKAAPAMSAAPWFSAEEEIYIIGRGFIGKPQQNVYLTNELRLGRAGAAAQIGHPTPKPIGLMESLITKTVGTVADPFAGSGATLIAARNLGRPSIGVELEERYCELIAKRLSQQVFDFGSIPEGE